MVTRAQFLAAFTVAFDKNQPQVVANPAMRERFLAGVSATLAGAKTVIITSQSFKDAWKACGLKGAVTYKALHALPIAS